MALPGRKRSKQPFRSGRYLTLFSREKTTFHRPPSEHRQVLVYAYAPSGQRAVGKVPRNYGANTTLIASLSRQGMGEALILEGAADTAVFEVYIEQILAPSLRPGQIVIMDNLSIHLSARVRQAIEAKGCQLLFLPA